MTIKNNIDFFRRELDGSSCRLIAVSKTQPVEKIREAYEAGQRVFGENKVQEMASKFEVLPKDIEWHLIGHLQSNKVKYIAPFVAMIHSVDSLKLLAEINKQAAKVNRVISCLLQIHIAEEETKFGLNEEEAISLLADPQISTFENIKIAGLMGMATFTDDRAKIKKEFRRLHDLFEKLKQQETHNIKLSELSMGMSSDYQIAIEEGSTLIRVGTSLFGSR